MVEKNIGASYFSLATLIHSHIWLKLNRHAESIRYRREVVTNLKLCSPSILLCLVNLGSWIGSAMFGGLISTDSENKCNIFPDPLFSAHFVLNTSIFHSHIDMGNDAAEI